VVTAKILVNTFIIPVGVPTTGERIGEKTARFEGSVGNIMDVHPLTVGPDSSALEVTRRMRDQHKSACIVIDEKESILGIITPRELMALLMRFKEKEELPVYILGLSDEDVFNRTWAIEKARRVVERGFKIHPHINETSITIKKSRVRGNRIRYEMTAQVFSSKRDEMFSVKAEGWGLLPVFNDLCKTLDRELRKSKHKPKRGSSVRKR
jgi:predicted transcriptional regulator